MTNTELDQVRNEWELNAAQLARVLCIHTSKMSEYLAGVTRIPCSIAMHIEALGLLSRETRASLFEERINRATHKRR